MTNDKLFLLLSRNIAQAASEKGGLMRKTYPEDKQYMAYPGTKEDRKDSATFDRRRDGVDSWQMWEISALLLIKTCIIKGEK